VLLLVVEDDPVIAAQVSLGMERLGHQSRVVTNGCDALAESGTQDFDVIVLDRMLPDQSGIEVLRQLCSSNTKPPVLMLSALGSVADRIQGLKAGADDYLAKPFDMEELAVRIEAIARRSTARESDGNIAVGSLQLDAAGHAASFRGAVVSLNRKQFSLLAHLMRYADRLVTRRMLLENVWGYDFEPSTNIVESNLSRLRTRLMEVGCDAIETKRGSGYLLHSARCH
jgi:two-component system, OmpR family, response regulator